MKYAALGCIRARQRAPADGVAVHVAIARKAAQPLEILGGQHLAAIQRLLRIRKRLRHPVVHAQIEIGEHKHRRLQPLRQIERRVAELEALLHGARQQNHVLGVAVRKKRRRQQIGLLRCAWACPSKARCAARRRSRPESRRSSRARKTPPSARCPGPKSRSWTARRPSPRPAPCRSPPARPRPAPRQRSPCPPASRGTSSADRSSPQSAKSTA